MNIFYQLLANSLLSTVTNMTVWFALTYYVYLQTRSVFATGMISGIYLVVVAISGFWFGSLVDHHKKKPVMLASSVVSLLFFLLGFLLYIASPPAVFKDVNQWQLWAMIILLMLGVIAGNIRMIALPTTVTLLIPAEGRDKANGLVGTASGISFFIVSAISGFLVAHSGMYLALILAISLSFAVLIHLWFIPLKEEKIIHLSHEAGNIDIRGTLAVVRKVPGLIALILFTTFNNFLGGVFMALMDAYGLSLVSVEVWGMLWAGLSLGFIVGGLAIAKWGLGKNPLKTLFLANIAIWTTTSLFTVNASIIYLTIGMLIYLCVAPYIEAAEQTIIQKVVPKERQGRVFGFAQSVEQMASPLTAFLIGPLTQFIFIPLMTTGVGAELIGDWFGTGQDRGIALVFTITGVIGVFITIISMQSKYYKLLSARYLKS